jgi:hypothetical protein
VGAVGQHAFALVGWALGLLVIAAVSGVIRGD